LSFANYIKIEEVMMMMTQYTNCADYKTYTIVLQVKILLTCPICKISAITPNCPEKPD